MESSPALDAQTLAFLRALALRFPSIDAVLAEVASLEGILTLPKSTIHVVSDVHGEFKKLRHVINNASGSLRPLVESLFDGRLDPTERLELLNFLYYPRETWLHVLGEGAPGEARRSVLRRVIRGAFEVVRELSRRHTRKSVERVYPDPYKALFRELAQHAGLGDGNGDHDGFVDAMLEPFVAESRDLELVRLVAHVVRNLSVGEIVVGGDLGDRGPRVDKVIDYLMRQPEVSITWGNHDASWMAACLGSEVCIATVLRLSLRYRRLSQLEEGFGISMAPVEKLVRTVYGDDPAEHFACKGEGLRDPLLMARMQKAMAIVQFKLEGQLALRNPSFELDHRRLLEQIDPARGTVRIGDVEHALLDRHLPTVDFSDPLRLSPEEAACLARVRTSFLESPTLWRQMRFVARRGSMHVVRDDTVIFHGCVPVDDAGAMLPFEIDGARHSGRALFDALGVVVARAFRDKAERDLDLLYWLWAGQRSPLFGKDRMATFETYFVADKATHAEKKNPYFAKIHEVAFCERILREFGADPTRGLIVNGHVPVRVENGEAPLKKSKRAVTIDGAFSEAYGDRGYTLVLEAGRTFLARHHHFASIDEAVTKGADIVPEIEEIEVFDPPRRVGDTEKGAVIRAEIAVLRLLARAYRENVLVEQ